METDILLLDGKYERLSRRFKIRVDLAYLTQQELLHLRNGVDSAIAARNRSGSDSRCWMVPSHVVEVFIEKD